MRRRARQSLPGLLSLSRRPSGGEPVKPELPMAGGSALRPHDRQVCRSGRPRLAPGGGVDLPGVELRGTGRQRRRVPRASCSSCRGSAEMGVATSCARRRTSVRASSIFGGLSRAVPGRRAKRPSSMVLAAYLLGPGHVFDAQDLARELGLNPRPGGEASKRRFHYSKTSTFNPHCRSRVRARTASGATTSTGSSSATKLTGATSIAIRRCAPARIEFAATQLTRQAACASGAISKDSSPPLTPT